MGIIRKIEIYIKEFEDDAYKTHEDKFISINRLNNDIVFMVNKDRHIVTNSKEICNNILASTELILNAIENK